ncbi:Lactose regulatory protein LAC9 [Zancudomyces culisetae]|uniref:Lactose regulatory protein LAC9 n=1 Tax=Zancudomyces culisetae TaxID=1213189 RepID=A0A1R1PPH2_ZANCU|nr:Lactose regulatory protein LAC9 [Zancudomyces culisetae]|eukprot:OMH82886.1 Lactose regulatory protein LAC9 [Zancudomyces culisetae]
MSGQDEYEQVDAYGERGSDYDIDENSSNSLDSEQSETETTVKLMHACDVCRKKKVKCDGNKPTCSSCLRVGVDCVYSPLIRKKKVRKSAIQKIEGRLESVEQILVDLATAVESGYGNERDRDDDRELALERRENGEVSFTKGRFVSIEMLSNEFIEQVIYKVAASMPLFTCSFRIPHTLKLLKKKELPDYFIYSILALGIKFMDAAQTEAAPIEDSVFASQAAKKIVELLEEPDVDYIQASVYVAMYYWGLGNNESAMVFSGIAMRGAEKLRLYQIDEHYCGFKRVYKSDQEDRELKRRLWWMCYVLDRSMMLNSALPPSVPDEDCVVNLPTNDYTWVYTDDELDAGMREDEIITESSRIAIGNTRAVPDTTWILCKMYSKLGEISQFVNRRRNNYEDLDFYSIEDPDIVPNSTTFFALANDLGNLKSELIEKYGLVSPKEFSAQGGSNTAMVTALKTAAGNYFTLHALYETAKIVLFKSELVRYPHETITPDRVIAAKQICIEASMRLCDLLVWATEKIPAELWDCQTSYWAFTAGTILVNCQSLHDHPLASSFKKNLQVITDVFSAQGKYYPVSITYFKVLQELTKKRVVQFRTKSLPEAHYRLTSSDTMPWLVFSASSFEYFVSGDEDIADLIEYDNNIRYHLSDEQANSNEPPSSTQQENLTVGSHSAEELSMLTQMLYKSDKQLLIDTTEPTYESPSVPASVQSDETTSGVGHFSAINNSTTKTSDSSSATVGFSSTSNAADFQSVPSVTALNSLSDVTRLSSDSKKPMI